MPTECKGYCDILSELTHPNIRRFKSGGFYESGGKWCKQCDKYFFPCPYNRCECCHTKLRSKAHAYGANR